VVASSNIIFAWLPILLPVIIVQFLMLGVAPRMGIWFVLFGAVGLFRRLFQSNLKQIQMNYLLFIWDVIVLFLSITVLKL